MAPEVGSGQYHRGIDIYAVGVMLYEMLLGRVPYEGSTMAEVLMKHLTAQPELETLPQPFGRVIRKALDIMSESHVTGSNHWAGDSVGQRKQGQYDGERQMARMGFDDSCPYGRGGRWNGNNFQVGAPIGFLLTI